VTSASYSQQGVIYGEDNRRDYSETRDSQKQALASSTVAFFDKKELRNKGNVFLLNSSTYGGSNHLCESEPFWDQPDNAFCSGTLVGEDLILTAGHCVKSETACSKLAVSFNYVIKSTGVYPTALKKMDVFYCSEIIAHHQDPKGADYAIIRLDRKVTHHKAVRLNRSGHLSLGAAIGVIGYPSGLPVKVAYGARVRDVNPLEYFVANTDSYSGSSGSGVFNEVTGLLEGVLVRGENDFVKKGNCYVSQRCPATGCRGEDVTKVSEVVPFIPEI
jgi:hypothetical protein